MNELFFLVDENFINKRVDIFLQNKIPDKSRAFIQKIIEDENVSIEGIPIKKSGTKLKLNQNVKVIIPEEISKEIKKENIPLSIVYEDKDIAIINKPPFMTVHPAQDIFSGTLVNALLYHFDSLSTVNSDEKGYDIRPGIVHRLDKNTSGLIIIAKTNTAHENLVKMFQEKSMSKTYIAICKGNFKNKSGRIENLIGRDPFERKRMAVVEKNGKPAISNFEVLHEVQDFSLVKVNIETGRTHQIRVHMKSLNHPIVGDEVYGSTTKNIDRQMLHAYHLVFPHPITNKIIDITGELPDDFKNVCKTLKLDLSKI